jgi:hypothetical protein
LVFSARSGLVPWLRLILDIEEKAMNYGYADPLAYDIIQTIREVRKKENSK